MLFKNYSFQLKINPEKLGFQKLAFSGEQPGYFLIKPGLSGEELGLSEKNLAYLIVVIFVCHSVLEGPSNSHSL